MADHCRNCGSELFVGQRFCRACGAGTDPLSDEQAPTRMMPPQPENWDIRSGAHTAPAGRPDTSPVYAPPSGYQPSVPPMYPQVVPPYMPPRSRSPVGWILAFIGMGLFAVVVLAVMFVARRSNTVRSTPEPPSVRLEAGEKALEDTADQVVTSGNETTLIKSFPLRNNARFSIKNISGSITVGAWDQPKAEVKVIKRGSDSGSQVVVNDSGGNLSIKTVPRRGNPDVRYEVKLPRELARIELESVNGSIKVSDVTGQVVLGSSNGNIDLTAVVGVSKVQTVNGKITAVLDEAGEGPMEFQAVNGKIDLTLKSDFNANLEVTTVHGPIDIDEQFGIPVQKEIVGRRARGQIGEGGQPLKLTTVNGSVKVSKQ